MHSADFELLEAHLLQENAGCSICKTVRDLGQHFRELQAFAVDLANHYDSPGPTPEKTAEHYQLAYRARLLRARIDPA